MQQVQHGPPRNARLSALTTIVLTLLVPLSACVTPSPRAEDGARKKRLTYDDVYGPGAVNFSGEYARGLRWTDYSRLARRDGTEDPVTGEDAGPADNNDALIAALVDEADIPDFAARRVARRPLARSEDSDVVLLEHDNTLYAWNRVPQTLVQAADADETREEITLSPDGATIAFVRANDIFTIDIATGEEIRCTHDGSPTLLNGKLDWVYQEELYGRGRWRAYWWSPDGTHIAYLQLDQTGVNEHTLVDHTETHPRVETMFYPKAGDTNPAVRLGVVPTAGGETDWIDLSRYVESEPLIVGLQWSPDGRLWYCVQDREVTWLDLNVVSPGDSAPRTVFREQTGAWVTHHGMPHWLDDGSFLWRSSRDGWPHLYRYDEQGNLLNRLTMGEWEVRRLHGVDETAGWVYFDGTRDSPIESNAYRVPLAGGAIERLTEPGFWHRVQFDPNWQYFIDTFSAIDVPPRVCLRQVDGTLVRTISANDATAMDEYVLSEPEVLRIPTPRGHQLNGVLVAPPAMQRNAVYPVIVFTYAGPHSPTVRNHWQGRSYAQKQYLAQQGYLVWTCDPYSASGEGQISAWHAYQRLGVTELEDLEDSVRWLAEHRQADLDRVGIVGSSYGGYIAAYALTHGDVFDAGIMESGLADWRNYDSIYTERYMRTPANNPDGYQQSSVLEAAHNLHGHLLIGHGALDDNVHVQNALQLAQKLQEAGKSFELMIYPEAGHGLWGEHWRKLQYNFWRRNLKPGPVRRPAP